MEICQDTGYAHVGLRVRSEAGEYDLLTNEKKKHDSVRKYRRERRNRLRHREPRFMNRRKIPPQTPEEGGAGTGEVSAVPGSASPQVSQ